MTGPLMASVPAAIAALPPERRSPPATSRPSKDDHTMLHRLLILQGLAGTADGLTTELALRNPNTREANPLMGGSGWQRNGIKAAGNVLIGLIAEKLHREHPKIANALSLVATGTQGAAAIHNARRLKR